MLKSGQIYKILESDLMVKQPAERNCHGQQEIRDAPLPTSDSLNEKRTRHRQVMGWLKCAEVCAVARDNGWLGNARLFEDVELAKFFYVEWPFKPTYV